MNRSITNFASTAAMTIALQIAAPEAVVAQTAHIVGLGATSCQQFLKDIGPRPELQRDYLAWAQGFTSGIILSRPPGVDTDLNLDPPSFGLLKQLRFLADYCELSPTTDFSDAVAALYKRLRQEKDI